MSMYSIRKKIREVIKDKRPELAVYPWVTNPIDLVDTAVLIVPDLDRDAIAVDYETDYSGTGVYHLNLVILAKLTDMESSQRKLDALISPKREDSIPMILKANKRLDGEADMLKVRHAKDYGGKFNYCEIENIGVRLKVEVQESCASTE